MDVVECTLNDVKLITPKVYHDSRGFFWRALITENMRIFSVPIILFRIILHFHLKMF